jgi:uncharacterized membrane protein YhaH (DUF805 family)
MKFFINLYNGRLNRRNLLIGLLSSSILLLSIAMMLPSESEPSGFIQITFIITIISTLLFNISLFVRRWHDLNKTGFMLLGHIVPGLGILFMLYAICAKGSSDSNKYGDPPPQKISFPDDILGQS